MMRLPRKNETRRTTHKKERKRNKKQKQQQDNLNTVGLSYCQRSSPNMIRKDLLKNYIQNYYIVVKGNRLERKNQAYNGRR